MPERLKQEILEELNDAWLNISVNKDELIRPLDILDSDDPDIFYKKLTWLMTNPDYFAFLCKHIFKIELLPFQSMILKELYTRRFPMLIASRGAGKAEVLTNKVLTSTGWRQMGSILPGDKVYSRYGTLCNVSQIYPQGQKRVYTVKLRDGRKIDCCEDHLWVVKNQKKERVMSTREMFDVGVSYPPTNTGGPVYKFKIPNCQPIQYDSQEELIVDPYILGCMLGDGCCTTNTPKIATTDDFIVNEFRSRLSSFEIKKDNSNCNYTIVDKNKAALTINRKGAKSYTAKVGNRFKEQLKVLGVNVTCKNKFVPDHYKTASVEDRLELVRGLLDTDGSITKSGSIEFTNTCEKLVDDLADILRSLGISCQKSVDTRAGQDHEIRGHLCKRGEYFRLYINTSLPVFKLPRKLERIKIKTTNAELYTPIVEIEETDRYEEMQCISVDSPDHTYITEDYTVTHNTFLMSLYCLLRALLMPNRKIVVVGAAFRQSKFLHDYMETIWKNSPILRDICDSSSGPRRDVDMCRMTINGSQIVALPIGDGQKIRGQRANDIISDEFASMSLEIFENVIAGFAAVAASPAEGVRLYAAKKKAKELGVDPFLYLGGKKKDDIGNQIVLAGTAYYDFNHFSTYWKRWKSIIKSKGDKRKLREIFGEETIPESFNWKDYSVTRIPVDLIPKGFMDEAQIARSKATVHNGIYLMEFGAVFCTDSAGFFKRSLIESCVGTDLKPVHLLSGGEIYFDSKLKGDPTKEHIIGVDPASEVDNFSIVVLELNGSHRRIVHCWTTNRQQHKERVKMGLTNEHDFYSYCARKIRDLKNLFPTVHIAMDSQGGGIAVSEALHDPKNLRKDEVPIWPVIEEDKSKDTDYEAGLHILELCNFAKYDWLSEANHGMRKDFEDKVLIFPRFDPITIGLSLEEDKAAERKYDTLEDCVMEIEELKNELSMIEIKQSPSGREQWNTPEIKVGVGKKERIRKDRYSALLMANMAARQERRRRVQDDYNIGGGFAEVFDKKKNMTGQDFLTPGWIGNKLDNLYG